MFGGAHVVHNGGFEYVQHADAMVWVCAYIGSQQVMSRITTRDLQISNGAIYFRVQRDLSSDLQITSEWSLQFHRPHFGGLPRWVFVDYEYGAFIPLWLPLSAVLGWLVIRELRWREKRAKQEEDNAP